MKYLFWLLAIAAITQGAQAEEEPEQYRIFFPAVVNHQVHFATEAETWEVYERCTPYFTLDSIPDKPHPCQIITVTYKVNEYIQFPNGTRFCIYPSILYHGYEFTPEEQLTLVVSPWVIFEPGEFESGHLDVTLLGD